MKLLNYRGLHDIKEEDEIDPVNTGNITTAEDNWVMILDERSGERF